ncbi:hypothetical protein MMPV_005228 [Pyropia vietnamensis]
MATIRRFQPNDLLRFNAVNVDKLTETYNLGFYYTYLTQHPDIQVVVTSPSDQVIAYMLSKIEGPVPHHHGHLSAVTVAPTHRRLGLAARLLASLEATCESPTVRATFVDLYVRVGNAVAIDMYRRFGYVAHRVIRGYYTGGEERRGRGDALDMRKGLAWGRPPVEMEGGDVHARELFLSL